MAYTVLARKYRSQTFDDVVGQDAISKTLKNAIKTGRIAHAFLFTGTRGVGKTTMARILAKALNCLSFDAPTAEPCCKCDSCTAVNIGEDIDVIEIDGASNNSVEEVRRLRENAIYRPARARFKIYIIDEVHMLSTSAFNALLKILEEPPDHVKFIFATTEPNKVIPTIQSRCQRFDFRNISPEFIANQLRFILKEEKIKYKDDIILPLAKMANGSMRDALSLLDRLISAGSEPLTAKLLEEFLGCPDSEKLYELIGRIGDSDAPKALETIQDLINGGLSEVQIVDALVDYMRDLMVAKTAGADTELLALTEQQREKTNQLAEKFDLAALIYNITALEKLRWTIKNSETARPLLEAAILRFALSEHFLNVDKLLSSLEGSKNTISKKNKIIPKSTPPQEIPGEKPAENPIQTQPDLDLSGQSIKDNWQQILRIISEKIGNGSAGLLGLAQPTKYENDILTITFPSSAEVQKRMCEKSSRTEQIQSLLSERLGRNIQLRYEIGEISQSAVNNSQKKPATDSQRKNQIMNHPAVKNIITELGATITDIDEIT